MEEVKRIITEYELMSPTVDRSLEDRTEVGCGRRGEVDPTSRRVGGTTPCGRGRRTLEFAFCSSFADEVWPMLGAQVVVSKRRVNALFKLPGDAGM